MKIRLFQEFVSMSKTCDKCGNEYWSEDDYCDDCKDTDLENSEIEKPPRTEKQELPFFGVKTTKSQNIYYL